MNYQALFEDNYRAFIIKKVPFSYDPNREGTKCVYRGMKNGEVTKCGIGRLIPDEMYSPSMEERSAAPLLANELNTNLRKHLKYNHSTDHRFVEGLQFCHDQGASIAYLSTDDEKGREISKRLYESLAKKCELKIPTE